MANIDNLDLMQEAAARRIYATLVSKVLEQNALLADQAINQALLTELIEQFVESERRLAEAHAEVLALSRTDGLTMIANRRWFDETLDQELSRASRAGTPLGLLLLDIDCFKSFNDHYGHTAGDECLRKIARAIEGVVSRAPDLAARYGGEELACILPGADKEGVETVGRALLEAIRGLEIPHGYSQAGPVVTVSIGGVSVVPDARMTAEKLIELADGLLYRSKATGRNRLTV